MQVLCHPCFSFVKVRCIYIKPHTIHSKYSINLLHVYFIDPSGSTDMSSHITLLSADPEASVQEQRDTKTSPVYCKYRLYDEGYAIYTPSAEGTRCINRVATDPEVYNRLVPWLPISFVLHWIHVVTN